MRTIGWALGLCAVMLAGCGGDSEKTCNLGCDEGDTTSGDPSGSTGAGSGSTGASTGSGMLEGCNAMGADAIGGEFLLALAANVLPGKPILFLATLTTAIDQGLSFSLQLQPLSAADGVTPVGAAISAGPYAVASDGAFSGSVSSVNIPAEANPISDSPIIADVELAGTLCAPADFVCGDVAGSITEPFPTDLEGSTFAMQRITEPSAWPSVVIDCAMTPPSGK